MENLDVTIEYSSEEPGGFPSVEFTMHKRFKMKKLPPMPCSLILHKDAIDEIPFGSCLIYDPEKDIYYMRFEYHEKVQRYYHGDAEEEMKPVLARFESHGWRIKRRK